MSWFKREREPETIYMLDWSKVKTAEDIVNVLSNYIVVHVTKETAEGPLKDYIVTLKEDE